MLQLNGTSHLRCLIFMEGLNVVCFVTPLVLLIFKVFMCKNLYYLELLLLDQTSEQLLI
jgi:hypothetical protein